MQCVVSTMVDPPGITAWRQNKDAAPCPAFIDGAPRSRAFLGVTLLPPPAPLPPISRGGRRTDGRQLDTVNNWTYTHTHTHTHDAQRLPPVRSCALLRNSQPSYLTSRTHLLKSYSDYYLRAPGGAVSWDTALQDGRSRVRFPMVPLQFLLT